MKERKDSREIHEDDGFPLSGRELIRMQRRRRAAEVPEELKSMDLFLNLRPFEHIPLDKERLAEQKTAPVRPLLPEWVDFKLKPNRVGIFENPQRKLWHRGIEVDPMHVFAPDDRKIYNDTSYPWGCVCKIVTNSGIGSGVIVGPRHVLTASHVVDWNSNGAGTVEVHRAGSNVSAITAVEKVYYWTKVTPPGVGHSEVDEDYAVLVTAERIGDRFGWMGVRTYNSGWDDDPYWYNIGYPGDVASQQFPIYQNKKELDEAALDWGPARSMTTNADVMKGQSGSPIFGFWPEGPFVVAVVSAQSSSWISGAENWCSGGNYLTRLVNYARAHDA